MGKKGKWQDIGWANIRNNSFGNGGAGRVMTGEGRECLVPFLSFPRFQDEQPRPMIGWGFLAADWSGEWGGRGVSPSDAVFSLSRSSRLPFHFLWFFLIFSLSYFYYFFSCYLPCSYVTIILFFFYFLLYFCYSLPFYSSIDSFSPTYSIHFFRFRLFLSLQLLLLLFLLPLSPTLSFPHFTPEGSVKKNWYIRRNKQIPRKLSEILQQNLTINSCC